MDTTHKLNEGAKVDVGLEPISLATTTKTGPYYSAASLRQLMFAIAAAAMVKGKTVVAQVLQATDRDGTGSKDVAGALATITSPTAMTEMTVTADTVLDGEAITLNGVVFTAEDTTPDADLGQYDTGANDTEAMANLAVVVNKLLPKVKATSAAAVLTLVSREPGEETITAADDAATLTPAGLKANGFVEVEPNALDINNGFTHVAIKITTDDTIVVESTLIRASARTGVVQKVAASAVV